MSGQFYANGKLLLSGEYLVLRGAEALAIPTRRGQEMQVETGENDLVWKSYDHQGQKWFTARLSSDLKILETSDKGKAEFLLLLLNQAQKLSHEIIPAAIVSTRLSFPEDWGLGSSSTLTHLIAQWLKIDPFELFFATQNGSGYDIACAAENQPIVYQLTDGRPHWKCVTLPEVFKESYFVHLGRKQQSRPEVERFKRSEVASGDTEAITRLTRKFLSCKSKAELQQIMREHEEIMAVVLGTQPVFQRLFPDFDGAVKSLGAWGGDFIWAVGNDVEPYFKSKGYPVVVKFAEMARKKVSG